MISWMGVLEDTETGQSLAGDAPSLPHFRCDVQAATSILAEHQIVTNIGTDMRQGLQETTYIKPYPQEALGGRLGLNNYDIAHSLRVTVAAVNEKLKRSAFSNGCNAAGMELIVCTIYSGRRGRPGRGWVFDVNAAKAFVAKWDNEQGWGYMKELLLCEKIVEKIVPQLQEALRAKDELIAKLSAPKSRRIPGRGIVSVITKTIQLVDMFGEVHQELRREKKLYAELSPAEQRAYKIQQRSAVMRGIAALQDDDINPKVLN